MTKSNFNENVCNLENKYESMITIQYINCKYIQKKIIYIDCVKCMNINMLCMHICKKFNFWENFKEF